MPLLVDTARQGTHNLDANAVNDAVSIDLIQVVGNGHTCRKDSNIIERMFIAQLWQGSRATDQPNSQLSFQDFSAVGNTGWLAGFGVDANFKPRVMVLVPQQSPRAAPGEFYNHPRQAVYDSWQGSQSAVQLVRWPTAAEATTVATPTSPVAGDSAGILSYLILA